MPEVIGWLGDQAMYRNEAFDGRGEMEGRFGDETARRMELRSIVDGELDRRKREFARQFEEWLNESGCPFEIQVHTEPCRPKVEKHYGIWHDKYEAWYRLDGSLFMTDSYALALFQLEAVPDLGWRVRCIEEWADEQQ